jgi:peptidoglycan/LPS O-acetylase OafA/YrhL
VAAPDQALETRRLRWLGPVRAVALILIFLNHAVERMGELPLVANPGIGWPPLGDRVSQLLTPTAGSWWDSAFNIIRYPGLLGEVGVQLFVIASGLGLTLSALRKGVGRDFLHRRAGRIVPTWVVVHLLALAASVPVLLFAGRFADRVAAPWDARFWLSLVGWRVTPSTIYYLVAAWWFIALLVQLYLVFPFLYRLLERWGSGRYWLVIGGAVAIKLGGLLVLDDYLDVWSRGAIFVTRLPEFAFGMLVAVWLTRERNPLRTRWAVALSAIAVPVGIASSLTLAGNAWGPFLYGAGLFVLLYRWLAGRRLDGLIARGAGWIGRHSLSLFIVHQPAVVAGPVRVVGGLVAAGAVTAVGAVCLEWVVARAEEHWRGWRQAGVVGRRVGAVVASGLVVYWGLVGADAWVRAQDPQEVLGWGERPSLQVDETLGWRLIPNQMTRLRWQGYDYVVTSNRFGFPGPADPPAPGDLRILTLGDAFTSAEGVDTNEAWPRLLEGQYGRPVTVWNGAVTGYGPNQYAEVAAELAPLLDPDVVVVGFFVNDFFEAAASIEEARDSIGFGRPDPTGAVPTLEWKHLSAYLSYRVTQPALALFGVPNSRGYFFGNLEAFEPGSIDADDYQAALTALREVRAAAPDARLVMMLVPASVQVCAPAALDYYPANIDPAEFDFEQPQRLALALADEIGAEVLDLRPALRAAADCPYQPANMHWLEEGHQIAAAALLAYLNGPAS